MLATEQSVPYYIPSNLRNYSNINSNCGYEIGKYTIKRLSNYHPRYFSHVSVSSSPSSDSDPRDIDEESSTSPLPTMEAILPYKQLNIGPSSFASGCTCGHLCEFREVLYELKKKKYYRPQGVTIRPKVPPIAIKLKS